MEILSLEELGKGAGWQGWIKDDRFYKRFSAENDKVNVDGIVPVKNYRNYKHFAGVIGKFNPYTFFLKHPIPIDELTGSELTRVFKIMPK